MYKQSFITILLTVLMSMIGAKAFAHDIQATYNGKIIYYVWENNKTELAVSYRGSAFYSYDNEYTGNVVIPESVNYNGNTYPVTSIGENAFYDCSGLTSVTIPNSVTSIGNYVFLECYHLATIVSEIETPFEIGSIADNTVTLIVPVGTKAAYQSTAGWSSFTQTVEVGEGGVVGSKLEIDGSYYTIGENNSASLTSANKSISGAFAIPSQVEFNGKKYDVTSIGYQAFCGCSGLTSITIPNSVTTIGEGAFSYCSGLRSVTIPSSVTSIGGSAFSDCSGLTSVTIPNSVTSIDSWAFNNCTGLRSVNISDLAAWCNIEYGIEKCNPLEYAHHLYINGNEITNLVIPNGVTSIGSEAFWGCSGLRSVTIPNSVTSIGYYAFKDCSGLTSVTIPNSVMRIGNDAFDGTAWFNNQPNGLIYVGRLAYKYKGKMPDNTSIIIENGTVGIAESAFEECKGLMSVTIPNSVTFIDSFAFGYCSGLTSVTIPNSVNSIGNNAFYGCSGLTSVNISDLAAWCNIKFGSNSFSYTHHLYINGNEITNLVIPNSVTSISGYSFWGCTGLTSVTIPNSVTSIGEYAFCYCSGLTSVIIPNSVTSIGEYAFRGCSGLTSITIPNSVTSIRSSAFRDCSGLISVTIPSSVTSIGGYAFNNCSSLTSVTIPSSATSISDYAFAGCSSLTSILSLNNIPPTCNGKNIFNNVNKENCVLWVPKGSVSAYKEANGWKDFTHIKEIPSGDLNFDKKVDKSDLDVLVAYIMGHPPVGFDKNLADINKDGHVDVADIVAFNNLRVGIDYPAYLNISSPSLSFEPSASSKQLTIACNDNWTASSSDDTWCTVSHASGVGDGQLTISVAENTSRTFRRSAVVTLQAGDEIKYVNVTQKRAYVETEEATTCIQVVSKDLVEAYYDTQFWILIDKNEPMRAGDTWSVSMKVRADKECTAATELHKEPKSYVHHPAIGTVRFTTAWTEYTASGTIEAGADGAYSIAFNLNDLADANTYYFDDISFKLNGKERVLNNNCDDPNGTASYRSREALGPVVPSRIVDKVIVKTEEEPANCLKVVSKDLVEAYYDTQFWILIDKNEPMRAGDRWTVSMKVRADKECTAGTEFHKDPKSYVHHPAIGTVPFTTEWTEYTASGTIEAGADGAYSIAFNLNDLPEANTYYFDDISFKLNGKERVFNNNCNDPNGTASYRSREALGPVVPSRIVDKVIVKAWSEPATCVKVVSKDMEEAAWDTQFWILIDKNVPMHTGDTWSVSMKVRADKECSIDTHIHKDPCSWIYWPAIGTVRFTTEWTEYTASGTIEAGADGGYSIAFDLNGLSEANTYYFDDISYKLNGVERVFNNNCDDPNGTASYRSKEARGFVVPSRIVDKVIVKN